MTKLKKVFFMAAMAASVSVFSGCGDDGDPSKGKSSVFDGKIQATVENPPSNAQVDSVKAMAYLVDSENRLVGEHVLAAGKYENGRFTLNLPETVSDAYLTSIKGFDRPGITVSDADAKDVDCCIYAYKDERKVGEFMYCHGFGYESGKAVAEIEAGFIYVDRDVNMTGSFSDKETEIVTYKVSLKKGWNKWYWSYSTINNTLYIEVSTTEPSDLKWYFDLNGN